MSRTVKHPMACKRAKCALCHPWKHGWGRAWEKMRFSDYRRYASDHLKESDGC